MPLLQPVAVSHLLAAYSGTMPSDPALPDRWRDVPQRFRSQGLRWTPQRRVVVEVLAAADGHVTSAELVERCRQRNAATIPSTVYRTLDALEELGLIRHGHGADGREEFHVLPAPEHGHRHCRECGTTWEIRGAEAAAIRVAVLEASGFEVDLSHLTIMGRCPGCRGAPAGP